MEIKSFLSKFIKEKGMAKLLRKEVIRYYESEKIYLNNTVKDSIDYLRKNKNGFSSLDFLKIWLRDKNVEKYFDFNGARLPDISRDNSEMNTLLSVFKDTFLFSCLLNDNYDKVLVEQFDRFMLEGPYGYVDTDFDITIKNNDIVIDAGAWIGDFSAYAASKAATVYAFEPINKTYDTLMKTVLLNEGKIIPIKKALGEKNAKMEIVIPKAGTAASGFHLFKRGRKEVVEIVTLDRFVEKENINKVDFIKADIEGAERYLLMGAKKVLREFAPKLAICTYHRPDDPELLEKIILDTNSKYCVKHTGHKLFAMVKK